MRSLFETSPVFVNRSRRYHCK